jgi:hypothetical protein
VPATIEVGTQSSDEADGGLAVPVLQLDRGLRVAPSPVGVGPGRDQYVQRTP